MKLCLSKEPGVLDGSGVASPGCTGCARALNAGAGGAGGAANSAGALRVVHAEPSQ